jgi:hypothetical protein
MLTSTAELLAVQRAEPLEPAVLRLELALTQLADALCRSDSTGLEHAAAALHKALLTAVTDFRRAALAGPVTPALRHRLVLASGQVAAQRQALARATASLDRAIDVLMPEHPQQQVYDAHGAHLRRGSSGVHV